MKGESIAKHICQVFFTFLPKIKQQIQTVNLLCQFLASFLYSVLHSDMLRGVVVRLLFETHYKYLLISNLEDLSYSELC